MTITGLKIKLDRPVDRERPCCRNICIIGPGKGPRAGALSCADCGQHRGWLSKPTAQWIEHVATRFGAPTTPIVVRKFDTYDEEEAPAEEQPATAVDQFSAYQETTMSDRRPIPAGDLIEVYAAGHDALFWTLFDDCRCNGWSTQQIWSAWWQHPRMVQKGNKATDQSILRDDFIVAFESRKGGVQAALDLDLPRSPNF